MIVRDRPSGIRLFFVVRGSILKRIWLTLLVNTLSAVLVTVVHGNFFALKITLTTIPFTLMGLPLAIFLGFRNSTAYDRYWEGRKLWGEIMCNSRNLARQCLSLLAAAPIAEGGRPDIRTRMIHRAIAYVHALRHRPRTHCLAA